MYIFHVRDALGCAQSEARRYVETELVKDVNWMRDVGSRINSDTGDMFDQLAFFFEVANRTLEHCARMIFHPDLLAMHGCTEAFNALPSSIKNSILIGVGRLACASLLYLTSHSCRPTAFALAAVVYKRRATTNAGLPPSSGQRRSTCRSRDGCD
jgi:hypothetical protein